MLLAGLPWWTPGHAAGPQPGEAVDGGVFLYREPVERYWNDWVAYPLMARERLPTAGQAELSVRGQGKTADFNGTLSINCENGKHYWKGAENLGNALTEDAALEEAVPAQAIASAARLFCRKPGR